MKGRLPARPSRFRASFSGAGLDALNDYIKVLEKRLEKLLKSVPRESKARKQRRTRDLAEVLQGIVACLAPDAEETAEWLERCAGLPGLDPESGAALKRAARRAQQIHKAEIAARAKRFGARPAIRLRSCGRWVARN